MEAWKRLLLENKAWAQDLGSHAQSTEPVKNPEFMWIGCSDARVPAERLTGSSPGDLYVHRNVANLVVHTDMNLLSALECGVGYLGVRHVVVCGHYGCHGVRAAQSRHSYGMMNTWLNQIKDVWYDHRDELQMHDELQSHRRLVELNVIAQIRNLARTEIIQRTWNAEQRPTLHGWVFEPQTHLIKPLVKVDANSSLDRILQLAEDGGPLIEKND